MPIAEDKISPSIVSELADVAAKVPAAAVLEGFARIESRLNQLLTKAGDYRPWAGSLVLCNMALDRGLISRNLSIGIRNLRHLRNQAAHRVGESDITADQAFEYLTLVDGVLRALDNAESVGQSSKGL